PGKFPFRTSLATIPDKCFPFEQELPPVQKRPVFDNITFADMAAFTSFEPIKRLHIGKPFFNETISYVPDFEESIVAHREEYKKLRRFHFGRREIFYSCL
ncbi:hypothetical protein OESDEN_23053, partial [Oesophagostomum dentatum]